MNPKFIDAQTNNEDGDNLKYSYDGIKHFKWYEHIILNRPLKVFVAFAITAVLVPVILYQFHFIPSGGPQLSVGSCLIAQTSRLPCGFGNVSKEECHQQCCYDVQTGFCFHRLPSTFSYIMDVPWSQYIDLHPRVSTIPYNSKASLTKLRLSINEMTATHLTIDFYNAKEPLRAGQRLFNKTYSYVVTSPELNVEIKGPQGTIFNTIRGPLIASDGIWEVTFQLTNSTMYGLGELPLTSGTTKVIYSNSDLSSIPLIFAKYNGSYHGLLFDMSAPTEVMVRAENDIIVRSLTDSGLRFHLFVGPTPNDIMKDAMNLIGSNWKLEYWMLGAHICGTSDNDLNGYIQTLTAAKIPFESHCGHRPIVLASNRCEATEEKNLQDVVNGANLIRQANRRFVPHISPYIRYNDDKYMNTSTACSILPEFDLFMYHDPRTFEIYKGVVDEANVMYPAYDVVTRHFLERLWPYTNKFDGLIIENNWPLDQSNKSDQDPSPYLAYYNEHFEAALSNTPTWNMSLLDKKKYFFKHNTYGQESINAIMNMTGSGIVPAVSNQWMNGNVMINRQNIDALWLNLHRELIHASLGGISGHWLWSSPICGDTDKYFPNNQTELCAKWYMASTYFPLVRIDANSPSRDPTAFNGTYRNQMITALNRRISFIPYFYTVLQKGPLLRPMFYQYPRADYFELTNSQFSVGDDLLIIPNLHVMHSYVHVTMPPGTWYEIWGGERVNVTEGEIATLPTLKSDFLTLIRGGSIIAFQNEIHETAEKTRKESLFSILIALECLNTTCSASGELYLLPGLTLNFRATHEKLYVTAVGDDFSTMCNFPNHDIMEDAGNIKIYGLDAQFNNYDTYRQFDEFIMFCDLEMEDVIEVDLI